MVEVITDEMIKNSILIDYKIYTVMELIFGVSFFLFTCKLLATSYSDLNQSIARMVSSLLMIFFVRVIVSFVILVLVMRVQDDEVRLQRLGFGIACIYDWILLSIVMIILFKFLFQIKRVQIQMEKRHNTMVKILRALKRQFLIEKIVLGFYTVNIIFMIATFIYTTVEQIYNQNFGDIQRIIVKVGLGYYSVLFVIDFCNLMYFLNMGCSISKMFKKDKESPNCFLFAAVGFIVLMILLTMFRFEIYFNVPQIFLTDASMTNLQTYLMFGPLNRAMIYMSKLTPYLIATFIVSVIKFMEQIKTAQEKEPEDENDLEVFQSQKDSNLTSIVGSIHPHNPDPEPSQTHMSLPGVSYTFEESHQTNESGQIRQKASINSLRESRKSAKQAFLK